MGEHRSTLKWGEGPHSQSTSNPDERKIIATTTGKGAPEEQAARANLDQDPEFSPLKEQGITAEEMERFISLMHGK